MEKNSRAFSKIYLPRQCSNKLLIPPQFLKYFTDGIPEKLILKNVCGVVWHVKLEIIDNNTVYISEGWEQYVKDHSLVRGDFLVFSKTIYHSALDVQVFGIHGCLKEEPFIEIDATDQSYRTNVISADVTGATHVDFLEATGLRYIKFVKTYRKSFMQFVVVPKHVLMACNYKINQDIILQNNKGVSVKTKLRKSNDQIVVGYAGLSAFWRKCNQQNGDTLRFIAILGEGRMLEKLEFSKDEKL